MTAWAANNACGGFLRRNLFIAFIFATSFSCQSISPEKNLRRWTTVELEDMKKKPKTSCYDADFLTHNRMCLLLLCVCRCSSTKRKLLKQRKKYISKSDDLLSATTIHYHSFFSFLFFKLLLLLHLACLWMQIWKNKSCSLAPHSSKNW